MSQALFTSITGMTTGQTKLDVVANNIANMNTTAYKASNLTFSDLYSKTLSVGSSPSTGIGGTNPMQVGLGVALAGISTDFTGGSVEQTGNSNDLNIQGNGWFTVKMPSTSETATGDTLNIGFTRDGGFKLDMNGNLVTQCGYQVMGSDYAYAKSSSKTPVWVPNELDLKVSGKNLIGGAGALEDLNNASITKGIFSFDVKTSGHPYSINIKADISGARTLSDIANVINTNIRKSEYLYSVDLDKPSIFASVNADGTFSINTQEVEGLSKVNSVDFTTAGDTSNFLYETGLATSAMTGGQYTSKVLSYKVDIAPATKNTTNCSKTSYAVSDSGALEVTYSNGDTLTVVEDHNNMVFKYITSDGKTIDYTDINVSGGAIVPANLQIQLASIQNEQGLVASNHNVFTTGPNSGKLTFSIGNNNGFGLIGSGGLESSNVNLAIELANMIVAQRGIDANSRVFSTTSDVLERLVNLQ